MDSAWGGVCRRHDVGGGGRKRERLCGSHKWQWQRSVRGEPGKEDSEGVVCVLWVFWKNTCAVPLKKLTEQPV